MTIHWGRFLLVWLIGAFISLFVGEVGSWIVYFVLGFLLDPIEFNFSTSKGKHAK